MLRIISESPGSVIESIDTRKSFPHAVPNSMLGVLLEIMTNFALPERRVFNLNVLIEKTNLFSDNHCRENKQTKFYLILIVKKVRNYLRDFV
ncbi:Polypeptide N-acetylgalactosaminyltransferase 10 [Meloidogyne graminicola]|uniref:Polypeptide N-acetylgalactosaminyltransferase 10 n=1 Tax=Meloidogyne graminicola TaxID=189291 RepID=A0A8T0A0K3_9BILA|nr:Polypeptide N-acetylgalactosaminyltransferase 10 [Meloidogyne graminicola]